MNKLGIQNATLKKDRSNIILDSNTSTLYLSPHQVNQGFQGTISGTYYPAELSQKHIQALLRSLNNPHSENEAFVTKCSKFLKFLFNKQCKNYDDEPYQRLDSKILGKKLGKNQERTPNYYPFILTTLIQIGLLEVTNNFTWTKDGTGECKGYRVVLKHPDIYKVSDTDDLFPQDSWSIDDEPYLNKMFQLEFDESMFMLIANLLPHDEKTRAFYFYHNWINKKHYVRVDSFGRIHTLLTILNKRFRCCFSAPGGEILTEVDIHACQPYLLLKLVQEQLNNRKPKKLTITELAEKYPELAIYINWIQNGRFYIEMFKAFNKRKSDPTDEYKLQQFKEMLFRRIFFSDTPNEDKQLKIHKLFAEKFPIIYKTLLTKKKKDGYKSVSCDLQTLESKIMNSAIAKLDTLPDKGFYLRYHDAFLTTDSFKDQVYATLFDCLKNEMGVPGKVKFGHKWGTEIETVLSNLKLMSYTTSLKHKGDRFVNKLIEKEIKNQITKTSEEDREQVIESINSKWNNDDSCLRRKAEIAQNFTFKSFYIPAHWSKTMVLDFETNARLLLNQFFDSSMGKADIGMRKIIEHNQTYILDRLDKSVLSCKS